MLSKRSLLSKVSSVFDPLGLISPLMIRGKMLIQRAWAEKLGWGIIVLNGDLCLPELLGKGGFMNVSLVLLRVGYIAENVVQVSDQFHAT